MTNTDAAHQLIKLAHRLNVVAVELAVHAGTLHEDASPANDQLHTSILLGGTSILLGQANAELDMVVDALGSEP